MDVVIENLEFIQDLSEKNYHKLVFFIREYLPSFNKDYLESEDRSLLIEKMHDFLFYYYSNFKKSNIQESEISYLLHRKKIRNLSAYLKDSLYHLLFDLNILDDYSKKHPVKTEYKSRIYYHYSNVYNEEKNTYSVDSVFEYIRLMNCAVNSYLCYKKKINDANFIFDYNEDISDKAIHFVLESNKDNISENDFYNSVRFGCIMYILFDIVLLDRLEKEGLYD